VRARCARSESKRTQASKYGRDSPREAVYARDETEATIEELRSELQRKAGTKELLKQLDTKAEVSEVLKRRDGSPQTSRALASVVSDDGGRLVLISPVSRR
jgi:antitoxin component HigA of HigAB toxin-antitoxin module